MGDAEVLEHDALVARTTANQGRAAAPDASAWVSANAGTGKTYVLTQRVLRLLLDGCPPDQILCLTYTNAAAAEMSRRVFDRLATWSITPPEALASELESLVERRVDAALVRRAAVLFAQAIETPGGLKVQTIHSFCERLLQRFPLEAGVAPEFSILDEQAQRLLMAQCTDQVLDAAARGGDPLLTEALQRAIAYAGETQFDALLAAVLTRRVALTALIRGQGGAGEAGSAGEAGADVGLTDEAAFAAYEADLFRHLGASLDDTPETFAAAQAHLLSDQEIASAIDVLRGGGKKDKERADLLAGLAAIHDASQRAAIFRGAFLTQSGTPLSSILVKAQREAHPGVTDMLEDARDRLAALVEAEAAFDIARASSAIVRLADAIFERYAIVKAQRAVLDYDDLILKSAALLRVSSDAQWVLYKLDNGLAHILVDEAQDTSPLQWQIVAQLAQEFFSGTGMHECVRTLFAVGDEKQSIYGFQGARPEMFARMGGQFAAKAAAAGQTLNQVPLTLSFRTVAPVLEAVDRTFAEGVAREGLGSLGDPVRHEAFRAKEEGLVELWPLEEPDDAEPPAAWRPFEHRASTAPVDRVAQRIARTVRHWLDTGALIRPGGPAITPGDILVLVQRRSVVVPALIRALKAAGVPVAGADRIRLTEQLAVMDLMALGDFVLLPEDDLTLACVMKSPLIGLDDDDLLTLVDRKEKTLWASLLAARDDAPRYAVAAERLLRWRGRADFSPPFEFFSTVLGEDRIRADVLARLGPEAGDALDEFLARALQFDRDAPSSLRGFLTALRSANVEIKRDMDDVADEVRIMTVHGAKGLEAPIVFLPDTCRTPSAGIGPRVIDLDVAPKSPDAQATRSGKTSDVLEEARPFAWAVGTFAKVSAVEEAKTRDAALDAGEYRRLLYVAMTRARDRLYIAGYRGKNSPPKDCWYHLIQRNPPR
ncbi:MAG: double-strand break repair helicase AddA [Pseudomonadota bacterium]